MKGACNHYQHSPYNHHPRSKFRHKPPRKNPSAAKTGEPGIVFRVPSGLRAVTVNIIPLKGWGCAKKIIGFWKSWIFCPGPAAANATFSSAVASNGMKPPWGLVSPVARQYTYGYGK